MKDNLKILLINKIKWSGISKFLFRFLLILIAVAFIAPHATISAQAAQDITITGMVTDASSGEALPGVNVVIEGTYTGAVTDLDGRFTIIVPDEEAVLSFSFIGSGLGCSPKYTVFVKTQDHFLKALLIGYL